LDLRLFDAWKKVPKIFSQMVVCLMVMNPMVKSSLEKSFWGRMNAPLESQFFSRFFFTTPNCRIPTKVGRIEMDFFDPLVV